MYSEEERAKFRLRFAAWKDGKKPYKGGRPSAISEVDKSDADFAERLRSNWRQETWDWEGSGKAVTHKIGSTDNIVYPNVQTTKGGGLIDFTNPIWKGVVDPLNRAIINKDYVPMKTELDAIWFGPNYKEYYPKFKDGKLPAYKDGKPIIVNGNPTNALFNSDGTFTDDITKVFDDLVITPKGPRIKPGQLYKYQEPWDDEKFMNAITVGGLNNLSPAQWARRGYDVVTGNLTTDSWLNGNAGIVPNKYAEQHPLKAMAANALFDFWSLGGPSLLKNATQIKNINPAQFTKYELLNTYTPPVVKLPTFEIEEIPGYQLKSLMRGNALEKLLSKQGMISVNSIKAHANKASEVEKAVINKILSSEEFAGLKSVDYNKFRKAIHDDLITYDVVPDIGYEDYGINRLGFTEDKHVWEMANDPNFNVLDDGTIIDVRTNLPVTQIERKRWLQQNMPYLRTYTFESPRIPKGSAKHYNQRTLGHSRTYTTNLEPDVLHVMESLSDWGLSGIEKQLLDKREFERRRKLITEDIDDLKKEHESIMEMAHNSGSSNNEFMNLYLLRKTVRNMWNTRLQDLSRLIDSGYSTPQSRYLSDNYTLRQIQENLKYAAEHGLTKMRYPTSETAAKIEGYLSKTGWFTPEGQELNPVTSVLYNLETGNFEAPIGTIVKLVYSPEHQTILKKYADFPKQFKKLHKNAEVRNVTDGKGNTWYEVDVPKDFLKREWMYGIMAPTLAIPTINKYAE